MEEYERRKNSLSTGKEVTQSMDMNRAYWDTMAPQWTQEIFNTLRHDKKRVILAELKRAAKNATSVADFGCGIGTYLPCLARLFHEVQGYDHSTACVEIARKRMRRRRHVSVQRAATAPKSAYGMFGTVLCVNAAIAPQRRAWHGVLRSAGNLLKPFGRLVLVVPSVESAKLIAEAEHPPAEGLERGSIPLPESTPDATGVATIDGVRTKHYSRAELNGALTGLGLRVYRIRRVEYTWRSQAVTPPAELRRMLPWDWLAVAVNPAAPAANKAA